MILRLLKSKVIEKVAVGGFQQEEGDYDDDDDDDYDEDDDDDADDNDEVERLPNCNAPVIRD